MSRINMRHLGLFVIVVVALGVSAAAEARQLNTTLGRWTRRDPMGYVEGANLNELHGIARGRADSFGLCTNALCGDDGNQLVAPGPLDIDGSCAELWSRCENNPLVKRALWEMTHACTSDLAPCNRWTLKCSNDFPASGATTCTDCSIKLNPGMGANCGTLAHELIHAADLCEFGHCGYPHELGDPNTSVYACMARICTELRGEAFDCCASDNPTSCFRAILKSYLKFAQNEKCAGGVITEHQFNRLVRICLRDMWNPATESLRCDQNLPPFPFIYDPPVGRPRDENTSPNSPARSIE